MSRLAEYTAKKNSLTQIAADQEDRLSNLKKELQSEMNMCASTTDDLRHGKMCKYKDLRSQLARAGGLLNEKD